MGELEIHAWVYKFETGEVFSYDSGEGQFIPLKKNMIPAISARKKPLKNLK